MKQSPTAQRWQAIQKQFDSLNSGGFDPQSPDALANQFKLNMQALQMQNPQSGIVRAPGSMQTIGGIGGGPFFGHREWVNEPSAINPEEQAKINAGTYTPFSKGIPLGYGFAIDPNMVGRTQPATVDRGIDWMKVFSGF